jgi:hypothetical protein
LTAKAVWTLGDMTSSQMTLVMLEPVLASKKPDANVLNATTKFVAKGGAWSPTKSLKFQIENVALGPAYCSSL